MQCYERQVMYLKLNSDAKKDIPQLEFDALLLDEVLADFAIESYHGLVALSDKRWDEIVSRIRELIGIQEEIIATRDYRTVQTEQLSVRIPYVPGLSGRRVSTSATIFP